jgi:hypothetical protein
MKRGIVPVILALVGLAIDLLSAGVVPGHWEKVKALERGALIIVFLQGEDRLECTYQATTGEQLMVATADQPDLTLPKGAIRKVTGFQLMNDSTMNGTGIGAGIGFGAGFAGMVGVEKSKTASE